MKKLPMHYLLSIVALGLFVPSVFFFDQLCAFYSGLRNPLGLAYPVVQMGQIEVGKISTRSVKVFNARLFPVKAEIAQISCGCTNAQLQKPVISPMRFGELKIAVTPASLGIGGEEITVKTSYGEQKISVLYQAVQSGLIEPKTKGKTNE
jgi:hypothetical protein